MMHKSYALRSALFAAVALLAPPRGPRVPRTLFDVVCDGGGQTLRGHVNEETTRRHPVQLEQTNGDWIEPVEIVNQPAIYAGISDGRLDGCERSGVEQVSLTATLSPRAIPRATRRSLRRAPGNARGRSCHRRSPISSAAHATPTRSRDSQSLSALCHK